MIEYVAGLTTQGLAGLVAAPSGLDEQVDDGERIDQLAGLERLKSAVAAAQVRVTVGFVASQEQIADGWREHARACSDAGDFDGWRQARDHAARASLEEPGRGRDAAPAAAMAQLPVQPGRMRVRVVGAGSGRCSRTGSRRRSRSRGPSPRTAVASTSASRWPWTGTCRTSWSG